MGANAYGQLVTIAIQLLSLPIFLSIWDIHNYGVWLTISAVPAYLSMADVGMVSVAGTRMTMLVHAGKQKEANQVFQSAQLFVGVACVMTCTGASLLILMLPFDLLDVAGARAPLMILTLVVLLSMASGLANTVFRATNRYGMGTFIDTNIRLVEWAGGMVGLYLQGSFLAVALGMATVRVAALLVIAPIATRATTHLSWGLSSASFSEIRKMIRPSLGFMSFPISNAINFQGFTLLAAASLGPPAVALFNTYRTLARVVVQFGSIFSHALWPELSKMFANSTEKEINVVVIRSSIIGLGGALLLAVLASFTAPTLLAYWTNSQIELVPELMSIFLIYAALAGSWHVPRIVLMASNEHGRLGFALFIVTAGSLLLAMLLVDQYSVYGLAAVMCLAEISMCVLCFYFVSRKNRPSREGLAPT